MKNNRRIGILNKGRSNKFINNKFVGLDIGIQDEGEYTFAARNEFYDSLNGGPRKEIRQQKWYQKWWMKVFICPLVVAIVAPIILFFLFN